MKPQARLATKEQGRLSGKDGHDRWTGKKAVRRGIFLKELTTMSPNDKRATTTVGSPPRTDHHPKVAVFVRRQTVEEERRFDAALKVFLAELVRQQLGRR